MNLNKRGGTWAIVLAAGEGSRLRAITTTASGEAVPKQFCSLRGGASLLDETLQRAGSVAEAERICAIVAEQHEQWWAPQLKSLPRENAIVQPQNRGTAIGILLPLVTILQRDPQACVVVLPSDHHVADEAVLKAALVQAVAAVDDCRSSIVLLGIAPEAADSELGYIVPRRRGDGLAAVEEFVEKPAVSVAESLIARGALWNAFVLVARASALAALICRADPWLMGRMWAAKRRGFAAVAALYRELPSIDFSHHVARDNESQLSVLPVPPCGWTDLGTVERLQSTLARPAARRASPVPPFQSEARLSLQRQHAEWQRTVGTRLSLAAEHG